MPWTFDIYFGHNISVLLLDCCSFDLSRWHRLLTRTIDHHMHYSPTKITPILRNIDICRTKHFLRPESGGNRPYFQMKLINAIMVWNAPINEFFWLVCSRTSWKWASAAKSIRVIQLARFSWRMKNQIVSMWCVPFKRLRHRTDFNFRRIISVGKMILDLINCERDVWLLMEELFVCGISRWYCNVCIIRECSDFFSLFAVVGDDGDGLARSRS